MIFVPRLIAPNKPEDVKSEIYECGEKPFHGAWFNYNPRFYMIAVIFIIFDVEVALTFPIATVYKSWIEKGSGAIALTEILVFVLILAFAFLRLWKKGDFQWNDQVKPYTKEDNDKVKEYIL
jgi:NADH-quinone oxidoreductase subunit A